MESDFLNDISNHEAVTECESVTCVDVGFQEEKELCRNLKEIIKEMDLKIFAVNSALAEHNFRIKAALEKEEMMQAKAEGIAKSMQQLEELKCCLQQQLQHARNKTYNDQVKYNTTINHNKAMWKNYKTVCLKQLPSKQRKLVDQIKRYRVEVDWCRLLAQEMREKIVAAKKANALQTNIQLLNLAERYVRRSKQVQNLAILNNQIAEAKHQIERVGKERLALYEQYVKANTSVLPLQSVQEVAHAIETSLASLQPATSDNKTKPVATSLPASFQSMPITLDNAVQPMPEREKPGNSSNPVKQSTFGHNPSGRVEHVLHPTTVRGQASNVSYPAEQSTFMTNLCVPVENTFDLTKGDAPTTRTSLPMAKSTSMQDLCGRVDIASHLAICKPTVNFPHSVVKSSSMQNLCTMVDHAMQTPTMAAETANKPHPVVKSSSMEDLSALVDNVMYLPKMSEETTNMPHPVVKSSSMEDLSALVDNAMYPSPTSEETANRPHPVVKSSSMQELSALVDNAMYPSPTSEETAKKPHPVVKSSSMEDLCIMVDHAMYLPKMSEETANRPHPVVKSTSMHDLSAVVDNELQPPTIYKETVKVPHPKNISVSMQDLYGLVDSTTLGTALPKTKQKMCPTFVNYCNFMWDLCGQVNNASYPTKTCEPIASVARTVEYSALTQDLYGQINNAVLPEATSELPANNTLPSIFSAILSVTHDLDVATVGEETPTNTSHSLEFRISAKGICDQLDNILLPAAKSEQPSNMSHSIVSAIRSEENDLSIATVGKQTENTSHSVDISNSRKEVNNALLPTAVSEPPANMSHSVLTSIHSKTNDLHIATVGEEMTNISHPVEIYNSTKDLCVQVNNTLLPAAVYDQSANMSHSVLASIQRKTNDLQIGTIGEETASALHPVEISTSMKDLCVQVVNAQLPTAVSEPPANMSHSVLSTIQSETNDLYIATVGEETANISHPFTSTKDLCDQVGNVLLPTAVSELPANISHSVFASIQQKISDLQIGTAVELIDTVVQPVEISITTKDLSTLCEKSANVCDATNNISVQDLFESVGNALNSTKPHQNDMHADKVCPAKDNASLPEGNSALVQDLRGSPDNALHPMTLCAMNPSVFHSAENSQKHLVTNVPAPQSITKLNRMDCPPGALCTPSATSDPVTISVDKSAILSDPETNVAQPWVQFVECLSPIAYTQSSTASADLSRSVHHLETTAPQMLRNCKSQTSVTRSPFHKTSNTIKRSETSVRTATREPLKTCKSVEAGKDTRICETLQICESSSTHERNRLKNGEGLKTRGHANSCERSENQERLDPSKCFMAPESSQNRHLALPLEEGDAVKTSMNPVTSRKSCSFYVEVPKPTRRNKGPKNASECKPPVRAQASTVLPQAKNARGGKSISRMHQATNASNLGNTIVVDGTKVAGKQATAKPSINHNPSLDKFTANQKGQAAIKKTTADNAVSAKQQALATNKIMSGKSLADRPPFHTTVTKAVPRGFTPSKPRSASRGSRSSSLGNVGHNLNLPLNVPSTFAPSLAVTAGGNVQPATDTPTSVRSSRRRSEAYTCNFGNKSKVPTMFKLA